MDFLEISSQAFRVDSEESREIALASIASTLSGEILRRLIREQNEALILNVRIGLHEKPEASTFVSSDGIKKLKEMIRELSQEERDLDRPNWERLGKAGAFLNELRAAESGWV